MAWLQRPSVLLGVAIGLGAAALLRSRPAPSHDGPRIEAPLRHFAEAGFFELVPPIALPTHADRSNRVRVWLKLPQGGAIDVERRGERNELRYPPGSEAARVEELARSPAADPPDFAVADVRGTRFLPDGRELFFVYRPQAKLGDPLVGFEWRRDDAAEEARATEALLAWVARTSPEDRRERLVERTKINNECARCHTPFRPDNRRPYEHGEVNRGTDASGLFLVRTVLGDEAPLESYQARNPALESPFVEVRCESGGPVFSQETTRKVRCPDGGVPRARFDLKKALAASDPGALAVCGSRRHLSERMTLQARAAFAAALSACGIALD